jgi:hypothetical protein
MTTDVTRPHPDPIIEGWLQIIGLTAQRAARYGAEDWIIERVAQAIRTGRALGPHMPQTGTRSGVEPEEPAADGGADAAPGSSGRRFRQ